MNADVVKFTTEEGGQWHTWPFRPEVKPSNPFLLTTKLSGNTTLWADRKAGVAIRFHALKLSDGAEWDSVNGFRKPEWNRPH